MEIKNPKDFKKALDQGAFAWPGGYPLYFIMEDSECLCPDCAKKEKRLCYAELKKGLTHPDKQWKPAAIEIHYEGAPLTCSNCNKQIESAYGDPEEKGEEG